MEFRVRKEVSGLQLVQGWCRFTKALKFVCCTSQTVMTM